MKRGAIFHTANYLLAVIIQMHAVDKEKEGTHTHTIIIDVILDLFLCKNNELYVYCFDTFKIIYKKYKNIY